MPYTRSGKCVYKKDKDGTRGKLKGCSISIKKAKKYVKALYSSKKSLTESSEKGQIVVDAVNEVIGNLPYGHKYRNDRFAQSILVKIFELLKEKTEITAAEAKDLVYSLTGQLKVL